MKNLTLYSCREYGTSAIQFSQGVTRLTDEEVPRGSRILVLVHGFRADYARVVERYEQVARSAPPDLHIVGFLWPGSWSHSLAFSAAESRTTEAGRRLAALVSSLLPSARPQSGVDVPLFAEVVVEGHSLGSAVALEAARCLRGRVGTSRVRRWVLCAPAIDANVKLPHEPLWVLHSRRDGVLRWAYRLAPQNWTSPAMGLVGPTDPHSCVHSRDMTAEVGSHSGYLDRIVELSYPEALAR